MDKLLNFDVALTQLRLHASVFTYTCKGVFNSKLKCYNISSEYNCAEGLHLVLFIEK